MSEDTSGEREAPKPKAKPVNTQSFKVITVSVNDIEVTRDRSRKDFGDIKGLQASLLRCGLISPLAVAQRSDGTKRLLAGERRLKAIKGLKIESVPCRVYTTDDEDFYLAVEEDENEQRKDFTIEERYLAAKKKMSRLGDGRKDRGDEDRPDGDRRKIAAESEGMSGATFARVEKVVKQGVKELRDLLNDEQVAVAIAAQVADLEPEQQRAVVEKVRGGSGPKKAIAEVTGTDQSDADEGEPVEPPKSVDTDQLGERVPRPLLDAFNSSTLQDAERVLAIVIKQMHSAAQWNPWLPLADVQASLKHAATLVGSSVPHAVCLKCNGESKRKECKECRTCGWMTENAATDYQTREEGP